MKTFEEFPMIPTTYKASVVRAGGGRRDGHLRWDQGKLRGREQYQVFPTQITEKQARLLKYFNFLLICKLHILIDAMIFQDMHQECTNKIQLPARRW